MGGRKVTELAVPRELSRDSSQLELFDLEEVEQRLPWDGQSPRVLTRSFQLFSVGTPPPWGLRD